MAFLSETREELFQAFYSISAGMLSSGTFRLVVFKIDEGLNHESSPGTARDCHKSALDSESMTKFTSTMLGFGPPCSVLFE